MRNLIFPVVLFFAMACTSSAQSADKMLKDPAKQKEIFTAICNDSTQMKQFMQFAHQNKTAMHMMASDHQAMMSMMKQDTSMCKMMMSDMMNMMDKDSTMCKMMQRQMMGNQHMKGMMMNNNGQQNNKASCPMHNGKQ